jgi:hypothetical protein
MKMFGRRYGIPIAASAQAATATHTTLASSWQSSHSFAEQEF